MTMMMVSERSPAQEGCERNKNTHTSNYINNWTKLMVDKVFNLHHQPWRTGSSSFNPRKDMTSSKKTEVLTGQVWSNGNKISMSFHYFPLKMVSSSAAAAALELRIEGYAGVSSAQVYHCT